MLKKAKAKKVAEVMAGDPPEDMPLGAPEEDDRPAVLSVNDRTQLGKFTTQLSELADGVHEYSQTASLDPDTENAVFEAADLLRKAYELLNQADESNRPF